MLMRNGPIWTVLAVAILAAGGYWWSQHDDGRPRAAAVRPPIPVVADVARHRDMPLYQTGLGNVVAYNTVVVRTQIDGPLQRVAFTEGQAVKEGDLLAQIDPRPYQARLAEAEAAKARDVAQLANAKLDLDRFKTLKEYATRQSVDTQQAQVAIFEAAIQGDQGQIEDAKIQLGYTNITAPLAGRTGIRQVDQGNIVHAADPNGLVVITQLQPISVIFTLPETFYADLVRARANGPLKLEAWSQDDTQKLDDGELMLIDNQIDPTTGTLKLKASFPNKTEALWPGQFVNAHLLIETRHDGIIVPAQAVQRGPSGTFVWIVKGDNSVEMRPIALGSIVGDSALIDKGVAIGEKVVTSGQYKLVVGAKVEPHAPDPTQTAEVSAGAGR
jgi:multidrug efflux system membrane fusion protein